MTAQASPTRNAAVSAALTAAAVVGLFGQQWPSIRGGGHMRERWRGRDPDPLQGAGCQWRLPRQLPSTRYRRLTSRSR
jgi:hypothetical protein